MRELSTQHEWFVSNLCSVCISFDPDVPSCFSSISLGSGRRLFQYPKSIPYRAPHARSWGFCRFRQPSGCQEQGSESPLPLKEDSKVVQRVPAHQHSSMESCQWSKEYQAYKARNHGIKIRVVRDVPYIWFMQDGQIMKVRDMVHVLEHWAPPPCKNRMIILDF